MRSRGLRRFRFCPNVIPFGPYLQVLFVGREARPFGGIATTELDETMVRETLDTKRIWESWPNNVVGRAWSRLILSIDAIGTSEPLI